MDCLSARLARGEQDVLDRQIAFARRRRTDPYRKIGLRDMHRLAVGIGMNRDRAKAHATRRADDPARNLAAIGDEERAEH
jgi:hypothetical protein